MEPVIEGTATDLPLNDVEGSQQPPQAQQEQLDAVIVVKTKKDDGTIETNVLTQGAVEATEVQTLLELAVNRWRVQIGLSK